MKKNLLKINDRYLVGFGYIYLPLKLDVSGLEPEVSISSHNLVLKNEFHVSLIYLKQFSPSKQKIILSEFQDYTSISPVEFDKFDDNFLTVKKDGEVSVIKNCELINLNNFTDHINSKYGFILPTQPTHVTIYVEPGTNGIGIHSEEDLFKYTKKQGLNAQVKFLGDIKSA